MHLSTSEGGRRRGIGVVATLQSPFSRPRRWCDAGSPEADQKAGAEGNLSSRARIRPSSAVAVTVLSSPAFWSAYGGPASPDQRGRAGVNGRTATTLIRRRRPPLRPDEPHRNVSPRGLPGIGIVFDANGCREVVPAQCRARHAPVSGFSACLVAISETDTAIGIGHTGQTDPGQDHSRGSAVS